MIQCFDWDSNTLNIKTNSKIEFLIHLKGNKTILCGSSATGKSLLCNTISKYQNSFNDQALQKYDLNNIIILNKYNKKELSSASNRLILVDRADLLLEPADIDIINEDTGRNKYMISSRKPLGIYLSPNYFAHLKRKDNIISVEYLFDIRGGINAVHYYRRFQFRPGFLGLCSRNVQRKRQLHDLFYFRKAVSKGDTMSRSSDRPSSKKRSGKKRTRKRKIWADFSSV